MNCDRNMCFHNLWNDIPCEECPCYEEQEKKIMFTKEELIKLCKMYEDKLLKLMGKKKYFKFVDECAKSLFADSVSDLPNGEFKQFILDNFDEITDLSDYENEEGDL